MSLLTYISNSEIKSPFNNILESFRHDVLDVPNSPLILGTDIYPIKNDIQYYTSPEYLDVVKKTPLKYIPGIPGGEFSVLDFAVRKWSYEDVSSYNPYSIRYNKEFVKYLIKELGRCSIFVSGSWLYHSDSCMGWHNNISSHGKHAYITYVAEDDKSYFRYYDCKKDEIVTSYDKRGWQIRFFDVPKEDPYFWHCIYSQCTRVSIGFRILDNL